MKMDLCDFYLNKINSTEKIKITNNNNVKKKKYISFKKKS